MTTTSDFPVQTGRGKAMPIWEHQLAPANFDDVLGSTKEREAWLAANTAGEVAERAYLVARKEARASLNERDFANRAAWLHELDLRTRDLEAEVKRCERLAEAALRAYRAAQLASGASLVELAMEKAEEADKRVQAALDALGAALVDRARFVTYTGGRLFLTELSPRVPPAAMALAKVMKERGPDGVQVPRKSSPVRSAGL